MNSSLCRVLCAIALISCFALPAVADSVAYTNLGPGGSYNGTSAAYAILGINNSGAPADAYQRVADLFTTSIGGTLSKIDLGLGYVGGTNSAVVSIYTDVSNSLGTLVFSGQVSNQPILFSTSTILATLSPGSGALVSGASYFLVVAPGAADTSDGWNYNSIGALGTFLVDNGAGFNPGASSTLQAFDIRVNAAAVPEPSTWLMLGAELFCLVVFAAIWKRLPPTAIRS
jgi:hypothetical protein